MVIVDGGNGVCLLFFFSSVLFAMLSLIFKSTTLENRLCSSHPYFPGLLYLFTFLLSQADKEAERGTAALPSLGVVVLRGVESFSPHLTFMFLLHLFVDRL